MDKYLSAFDEQLDIAFEPEILLPVKKFNIMGTKQAEAMKIEKFVKNQKSRKFIEKLVAGGQFTGVLTHLVRVPLLRD